MANADLTQNDVAAILEGLRADVRAQRLARGRLEPAAEERELQRALDEIELHRVVSAHWPLTGSSLPQRGVNLVNKLVRRYLRWYINPIVEQQNAYNDTVARALRLLADAYADLGEQMADLREEGVRGSGGDTEMGRRGVGEAQGSEKHANVSTFHPSNVPLPNPQTPDPRPQPLMTVVRERAATEPAARFPDLELRALELSLRLRAQVNAHWPLPARTWPERGVALVNKLVRRYLRWYINPIVEQQNAANAALSAALLALVRLDAERRAVVAGLRAETRRHGDTETRR